MKILCIRLGAIGDMVLTTPALRALRQAQPGATIHYLVKPANAAVLETNPHLDAIIPLGPSLLATRQRLAQTGYDVVVDWHKNLRSYTLGALLGRPVHRFSKANAQKRRLTRQQEVSTAVPHIVDRYAQAVAPLGAVLDDAGLEYPLTAQATQAAQTERIQALGAARPLAVVLGATWPTKRWTTEHLETFLRRYPDPVWLLGGPAERPLADHLLARLAATGGRPPGLLDGVGRHGLQASAARLAQCWLALTHDTGLMHLGAALQVPQVVLWGNTAPPYGMTPYRSRYWSAEVLGLPCRPCSRIGYASCPQGHFRCMNELTPQRVLNLVEHARQQLGVDQTGVRGAAGL